MANPRSPPVNTLSTANRLIDLGYWPLLIRPGEKAPLETFKNRGPPDREELLRKLRRWPRANISCRLPGLLALDADDEPAREIIRRYDTPFVQRSPKGEHRLFRLPDGVIAQCRTRINGIGLDIKTGPNAYLMLSPSVVDGRRYVLTELVGPDDLPVIDPTPFLKEVKPELPRAPRIDTPSMDRVYRYLDRCDEAVQGQNGSAKFVGALGRILRAFGWLSWDEFVSAATYFSDHRSTPGWSEREIIHACTNVWRKERS